MIELVQSASDPFARTSFEPGHFTASAFIVSPRDASLLLVFHGKLKRWLQPGGHIDTSDADIFAAARREACEETGVVLEPRDAGLLFDLDIHVIPARSHEPAHEHFDVRTLWLSNREEVRAGSDALEVRWHSMEELAGENLDESVGRALRKIRSALFPPPARR
ncbi:MAG TPA: NUDIX domain-containing protein [bacterium]|nr:NUDIX domain-containing protein [bacterium]